MATRRVRDTQATDVGAHTPVAGASTYVARSADPEIERHVAEGSRLVVVTGEALSGKSRSAFEAVARRLGSHRLRVPAPTELAGLLTRRTPRRGVIWLDDLPRYLDGDGLPQAGVERWLSGGRDRAIVATIGQRDHDRLDLEGAAVTTLRPELEGAELADAQAAYPGLDASRLPRSLVNADGLLRRWEAAQDKPRLVALVRAASADDAGLTREELVDRAMAVAPGAAPAELRRWLGMACQSDHEAPALLEVEDDPQGARYRLSRVLRSLGAVPA